MKSAKTKTRYFKKDYAPARAMAARQKSRRRSNLASASTKTSSVKSTSSRSKSSKSSTRKLTTSTKRFAQKVTAASKSTAQKLSAQLSSSTPRRAKSRRRQSSRFTWREVTLVSLLGTSAVMIAFAIIMSSILDPVKRSERELSKLADNYYIEYLYPRTLGGKFDEAEAILKDFTVQGLPNVRLRQLLLYDDAKYASSIEAFSNSHYECDTNKTYVRYFPVEPYGPRDYTVEYGTSCEKLSQIE